MTIQALLSRCETWTLSKTFIYKYKEQKLTFTFRDRLGRPRKNRTEQDRLC